MSHGIERRPRAAGAEPCITDSGYSGPRTVSTVSVGGRALRLARPAEPDRLLEDDSVLAWNARDDYMPYWAYLWPGAFLLAEAVAAEPWPERVDALEIGCGLGLAGLVALAAGVERVHFTDYDEAPLAFVRRSVLENGFAPDRASFARLDWREPPPASYPLILGADVLYERRLVPLVVGLIDRMLAPDGVAFLAGPYRVATEDLPAALEAAGLEAEARALEAQDNHGRLLRGTAHRVRRHGRLQ